MSLTTLLFVNLTFGNKFDINSPLISQRQFFFKVTSKMRIFMYTTCNGNNSFKQYSEVCVCFADVSYMENEAYNIVGHGEKQRSVGKDSSDDKESTKVIYEQVS